MSETNAASLMDIGTLTLGRNFEAEAQAECRRIARKTGYDRFLTLEHARAIECDLRLEAYREAVQPIVRIRSRMFPLGGFSMVKNADGSFRDRVDHWSDEQLKVIQDCERLMAEMAEIYGLRSSASPPLPSG